MSCFICRRISCTSSFHSIEEQKFFEPAADAYDRYLEIREKCEQAMQEHDESQEDNQP